MGILTGAVSGLAGGAAGQWAANSSVLVNNINSPLLRSAVVSPLASGAGHIAGGTASGIFAGQSLGTAFSNSFEGLGQSMAIGGGLGVATTVGVSYANGINPINGKPIPVKMNTADLRNGYLAGKQHPKTGVPFTKRGFPNFKDYLYKGGKNDIFIEPTGTRAGDFAAANKAAGYVSTPKGHTWHHHQTTGRMQLVNSSIHAKTGHTGGFSLWKY